MLDKHFTPADIETRLYEAWEASGVFRANQTPDGDPFCIVIPPPNVTGSLHMGHALNNTLQDILCRFERMRGRDVLWQPGLDHAGIATQMVVERQMMERREPGRRDIGREAFLEKIWTWKAESGGTIIGQLRRLGASCDWSRERFTMDDGLSKAVHKVFVQLYREGLVYKDKRLVNWDPKLLTAISDLEVQQVEMNGSLWHFRYPIEDEADRFITVATTRPETMLGDSGVAVHPDDERYRDLIGRNVVLPLVGRLIPIVADDYADPEAGSGAVKITPAHDFNDFEVGKRNDLDRINIMDVAATIVLDGNEDFLDGVEETDDLKSTIAALHGKDRFEARKLVVAMIEARGLLEKIEPHTHTVPHGDRGGVPIEPFLTDQWYVDAETLAKPAIEAVEKGDTVFVPRQWDKTYFEWMRNIQPWCISRQLWWGHQILAWYGEDGTVFVAESEALAEEQAESHYGHRVKLARDEDVLDTWFSSALWPFSTLGWPDNTHELQRYYPTNTLVTGFDIIFFWVARMMMMGLHFMEKPDGSPQVPFDTVYIHALVRDEKGQKMSKSKGNVIDPLELIDEYGADALRFTLAAMAAQGRDIKLSTQRVEGYRNFGTKLWNAARFAEMNDCARVDGFDPAQSKVTLNRWIAAETARTKATVTAGIAEHRYNEAAGALYGFVWHTFCDWYVELSKSVLNGEDEAAKAETRAATAWALDQILLLLHPFMPFITEELWRQTAGETPRGSMLAQASWPEYAGLEAANASEEIDWVVRLITEIRSVRSEMNVPAGARVPCVLAHSGNESQTRATAWMTEISRLARLDSLTFADEVPENSAQIVLDEAVVALPLAGVIDFSAEKARLEKDLEKTAKDITSIDGRLNNAGFVAKAPSAVIVETKDRREELNVKAGQIKEAIARLAAMR